LQVAQLVVVVLFGLIAVGTTIGVTRTISVHRLEQQADQDTMAVLVSLRDQLRSEHVRFWRFKGLTRQSRLFAATGPALVRQVAAHDAAAHSKNKDVGDAVTARVDELVALVNAVPVTARGGGALDRDFITAGDAALNDVIAASDAWIARKRGDVDTATRGAERDSRLWTVTLLGLLALMTAVATGIWWRLGRARSRLVHALEGAATQLARRAETDQLTGLTGHATFQERLSQQVGLAQRERSPLSLVLIDLDHFKEVNDAFGHQVGDAILCDVARLLSRAAGPDDIVARVGGEEFAWVLPGRTVDDALGAAERLRAAVASTPINGARITLSAGVCDLTVADTAAGVYRLADGALYWAKAHGRNIVFRYEPEIVEELSATERADRLERLLAVNTVRTLARAVDAKDPTTQRHSERVGDLARALALKLGWSPQDARNLREAALVHDVGKIGIPDAILFKPDRLDAEERRQVETHAALGAQIVSGVLSDDQVSWVRGHHERIDGSGYPDRLAGDEIPEGARILALADAWDAMRSARPYSDPLPADEVLAKCLRHRDTQFWGPAVDALQALVAEDRLPVMIDLEELARVPEPVA
jgi:diguanylate cyclase (GGDEF)-like protein